MTEFLCHQEGYAARKQHEFLTPESGCAGPRRAGGQADHPKDHRGDLDAAVLEIVDIGTQKVTFLDTLKAILHLFSYIVQKLLEDRFCSPFI